MTALDLNPASETSVDHGSLIQTIMGAMLSLMPLTVLMQHFMSSSDLIKDLKMSFRDMTCAQIGICTCLYAQAYHHYTSLSLSIPLQRGNALLNRHMLLAAIARHVLPTPCLLLAVQGDPSRRHMMSAAF